MNAIIRDIISESDYINKIEFESKILARWKEFGRTIRAIPIIVDQSNHLKTSLTNLDKSELIDEAVQWAREH